MKCPKCRGEIPFYNLKPNCSHCGVNIMYFSHEAELARDAKRTELEGAVARMVVARIKATFIGSKLVIARLVFVLAAIGVLAVPFAGVAYRVPYFDGGYSAGLVGIILAFTNGMALKLPQFLQSPLLGETTRAATVSIGFVLVLVLLAGVLFLVYLLSFLNITKGTKALRAIALIGAVAALAAQIVSVVMKMKTADSPVASVSFGFGGIAAFAVWLVLFFLNQAILKKGIEPTYRENDIKRRELLKRVRAGEVDLNSLTLPVMESEEERAERMKALEEALKAEEEGKEL